ncbi:hypothetical protein QCE63_28160 [Caballeronia sp. LZ065]|uniref:hypothetical protein n=1 Tax=Caballeronia sp. LZ065 TaxID=3038571 RepID=UPI002865F1BD|nr:hypothetical protein [Caballeronia sp. LZ065]MDR5783289.1 hypothetical protein [Caballeronia sp. LZ065]
MRDAASDFVEMALTPVGHDFADGIATGASRRQANAKELRTKSGGLNFPTSARFGNAMKYS